MKQQEQQVRQDVLEKRQDAFAQARQEQTEMEKRRPTTRQEFAREVFRKQGYNVRDTGAGIVAERTGERVTLTDRDSLIERGRLRETKFDPQQVEQLGSGRRYAPEKGVFKPEFVAGVKSVASKFKIDKKTKTAELDLDKGTYTEAPPKATFIDVWKVKIQPKFRDLYSKVKPHIEREGFLLEQKGKTFRDVIAKLPKFTYTYDKKYTGMLPTYEGDSYYLKKQAEITRNLMKFSYEKVPKVAVEVVKGGYESVRTEPEKVITSFVIGAGTGTVIKGAGAIATKTKFSQSFGRFLGARSPTTQKAIVGSPKVILGGLYATGKTAEIMGLPSGERAKAVGGAVTTELLPFYGGIKSTDFFFREFSSTQLRLSSKTKAPVRTELKETKTVGKVSPVKKYSYGYGFETDVGKGYLKLKMTPEQYAWYLRDAGKITYDSPIAIISKGRVALGTQLRVGPGKSEINIALGVPAKRVKYSRKTGRIQGKYGYELKLSTPKERSITTAHELIHHKTPDFILDIDKLPYRLQPAEILAFGGESAIKKFAIKIGAKEYKSIIPKYRKVTVVQKTSDGTIEFKYPRKQLTTKEFGKKTPDVGVQRGTIRKQGELLKILQVQVGKKPSGVIRGDVYDIYFKRGTKGIDVKYLTKGSRIYKGKGGKKDILTGTVLKETTIPYKKQAPIPFERTTKILKDQSVKLGARQKLEGGGGADILNPRQIWKTREDRLIGAEKSYRGLRKYLRKVTAKSVSKLSQTDAASAKEIKIMYREGSHWKQIGREFIQPHIKYVKKVDYRIPHRATLSVDQGKLLRVYERQPKLVTERKLSGESTFRYVEKESGIRPYMGIRGKKGQLAFMPKKEVKSFAEVLTESPTIGGPTAPLTTKPIINLQEAKKILSLRPTMRPVVAPVSKPIAEEVNKITPTYEVNTRNIVRNLPFTSTVTPTVSVTPTVTKIPIVSEVPVTSTVTRTPTVSVTPTVTRVPVVTKVPVTSTVSRVATTTITPTTKIVPKPPRVRVPERVLAPPPFMIRKSASKTKGIRRIIPIGFKKTYTPTVLGVEKILKPIKGTKSMASQIYSGIVPRPQVIIPKGLRPVRKSFVSRKTKRRKLKGLVSSYEYPVELSSSELSTTFAPISFSGPLR